MAVKDFLECATALSYILLDEIDDDDLYIVHDIDLSEFEESPHFKNYSLEYVLGELHGFKVKTCVEKSSQDCYSIYIILSQSQVNFDTIWPVYVEWKLYVIDEDKEQALQLQRNGMDFQKLHQEKPEEYIFKLDRTRAEIKDFIKDDTICFRWTVKLLTHQKLNVATVPTGATQDSPFQITDFNIHLNSLISKVQVFGESLKSNISREDLGHIAMVVSECEQDDLKLEKVENTYHEIKGRVETLKEKFTEQKEELAQFMSEWGDCLKKETVNEEEVKSSLKDIVKTCQSCGSLLENEGPSEAQASLDLAEESKEDAKMSKDLNFLLIGERHSGKSATGNSILQTRSFESGMNKTYSRPQNIQCSALLDASDTKITVVESYTCMPKDMMAALKLCKDGFDAIVNVVKYEKLYKQTHICSRTRKREDEHLPVARVKDEALKHFGVLLITGGDSFQIDNPGRKLEDFAYQWVEKYRQLERLVNKRVIVFDNTTTSKVKRAGQLKALLETVESLKSRPSRLNEDTCIEYGLKLLKTHLEGLHILTDYRRLLKILEEFSFFKDCTQTLIWKSLQTIKYALQSMESTSRFHDFNYSYKVLLIGKSSEALASTKSCIENMGISTEYSHNPKTEIYVKRNNAVLLVKSCVNSSDDDELDWKELKSQCLPALKEKGILILIDGSKLSLNKTKIEIAEWCRQETGLISEMFKSCSFRVVLLEYNTTDVLVNLEQEAELIKYISHFLTHPNVYHPTSDDYLMGNPGPLKHYFDHSKPLSPYYPQVAHNQSQIPNRWHHSLRKSIKSPEDTLKQSSIERKMENIHLPEPGLSFFSSSRFYSGAELGDRGNKST
ncbi:unnamed protein product [Lymnaea stagnalis]|uniref:AIG1-type G domain-containing protein n=1 Tax=Lymnaea stagnalis TaxID=6523 RepID=A0AAV2H841_LYMST